MLSRLRSRPMLSPWRSVRLALCREDHVSMATHGARHLEAMTANVGAVIGVELIAVAQGREFHQGLASSAPLESVRSLLRTRTPVLRSRLNMAEIEVGLLERQYLARYAAHEHALIIEVADWESEGAMPIDVASSGRVHTEMQSESRTPMLPIRQRFTSGEALELRKASARGSDLARASRDFCQIKSRCFAPVQNRLAGGPSVTRRGRCLGEKLR